MRGTKGLADARIKERRKTVREEGGRTEYGKRNEEQHGTIKRWKERRKREKGGKKGRCP